MKFFSLPQSRRVLAFLFSGWLGLLGPNHTSGQTPPPPGFPRMEGSRYVCGGDEPTIQTFVVPMSGQRGVLLDPVNSKTAKNTDIFNADGSLYWWFELPPASKPNLQHFVSTTTAPLPMTNPLVAFGGGAVGGSNLYRGQPYQFGAYSGGHPHVPAGQQRYVIRIREFKKSATSIAETDSGKFYVAEDQSGTPYIKRDGLALNNWSLTDDTIRVGALLTSVKIVQPNYAGAAGEVSGAYAWGVTLASPYIITHTLPRKEDTPAADTAIQNFDCKTTFYLVEIEGEAVRSPRQPMVTLANSATKAFTPVYTLQFSEPAAHMTQFLDRPTFDGAPMPPTYAGKALDELLKIKVTLVPPQSLTNLTGEEREEYLTLDDSSPELRRHPGLDEMVDRLNRDPIAIANFVLNDIQVTDLKLNRNPFDQSTRIDEWGVSRGALGTLLEKKGTPTEQCALLIYLLRRAGYPACYYRPNPISGVPPTLLNIRLGKIARIDLRNAIDASGNSILSAMTGGGPAKVNVYFPFVFAYVDGEWRGIVPWIKNTEIIEGAEVLDVLPNGYDNNGGYNSEHDFSDGVKWVTHYVTNHPAIIRDPFNPAETPSADEALEFPLKNIPRVLFPRFLEGAIQGKLKGLNSTISSAFYPKRSFPELDLASLGVQVRDRQHYYRKWAEFPSPFSADTANAANGDTFGRLNEFPFAENLFETFRIQAGNMVTGRLNACDFHNRSIFLRAANSSGHVLVLESAPFRPGYPGTSNFRKNEDGFDSSAIVLSAQHLSEGGYSPYQYTTISSWYRIYNSSTLGPWDFSCLNRPMLVGDRIALLVSCSHPSEEMIRAHARELVRLAREDAEVGEKEGFTPNSQEKQLRDERKWSELLFMAALTYKKNVMDFDRTCASLFKAPEDRMLLQGSARWSARGNRPGVDMSWFQVGNVLDDGRWTAQPKTGQSSIHAGFGGNDDGAFQFHRMLSLANTSAEEHAVLNSFFKTKKTASTISVLQDVGKVSKGNVLRIDSANFLDKYTLKQVKGSTTITPRIASPALKAYASHIHDLYKLSQTDDAPFIAFVNRNQVPSPNGKKHNVVLSFNFGSFSATIDNINGGVGPQLPATANVFGAAETTVTDSAPAAIPKLLLEAPPTLAALPDLLSDLGTTPIIKLDLYQQDFISGSGAVFGNLGAIAAPELEKRFNFGLIFVDSAGGLGTIPPLGTADIRGVDMWIAGDPVNVVTGAFEIDEVDLVIPSAIPLEVRRNYSSRNAAEGEFGYGWKLNFVSYLGAGDEDLTAGGTPDLWAADMDGSVIKYVWNASLSKWKPAMEDDSAGPINISGNSMSATVNRLNATIARTADNRTFTLDAADGSKRTYYLRDFPLFNQKKIITRPRPYLYKWRDASGNLLWFTYEEDATRHDYGLLKRVDTSSGFNLTYEYNASGRVTEVRAGDGRRVLYRYDQFGDLVEVLRPDNAVFKYSYLHAKADPDATPDNVTLGVQSRHLVVTEEKPGGVLLRNTYEEVSVDVSDPKKTRKRATGRVIFQEQIVGTESGAGDKVRNGTLRSSMSFKYRDGTGTNPINVTEVIRRYSETASNTEWGATIYTHRLGLISNITYKGKTTSNTATLNAYCLAGNAPTPTVGFGTELGQVEQEWWMNADVAEGAYPRSLKRTKDQQGLKTFFYYYPDGNIKRIEERGELDGDSSTWTGTPTEKDLAVTNFAYKVGSPFPLVSRVDRPGGFSTAYAYDDLQNPALPTAIEEFKGVVSISRTTMAYEDVYDKSRVSYGRLRERRVAEGTAQEVRTEWRNDARGFPLAQIVHLGNGKAPVETTMEYNDRGEMTQEKDPRGATKIFDYDALGRRIWTEVRDETGKLVHWNYDYFDGNGNITWSDGPKYDPEDYVFREYDRAGKLAAEHHWRTQANASGTGVGSPAGEALVASQHYFYDRQGNVTRSVDPRGVVTLTPHDGLDRPTAVEIKDYSTNSAGVRVAIETIDTYLDASSLPTRKTSRLGGVTQLTYTSRGKLMRRVNPDGTIDRFRYFLDGRLQEEARVIGNATNDLADTVVVKSVHSDWNTSSVAATGQVGMSKQVFGTGGSADLNRTEETWVDLRGNTVKRVDLDTNVFLYGYDALNRLTSETGPPGAAGPDTGLSEQRTKTIEYDSAGRMTVVRSGSGESTTTIADVLGRTVRVIARDASGIARSETTNSYSPDHHFVTSSSGLGQNAVVFTTYTNNAGKPVLSIRYGLGGAEVTINTYDAGGFLKATRDPREIVSTASYDALGRVTQRTIGDGSNAPPTVGYSYVLGTSPQAETQTISLPGLVAQKTTIDSVGRISAQYSQYNNNTGAAPKRADYTYYLSNSAIAGEKRIAGLLATVTTSAGIKSTTTYDSWLRPSNVAQTTVAGFEASALYSTSFTRDFRGNVTSIVQTPAAVGSPTPAWLPSTTVERVYDGYAEIIREKVTLGTEVISDLRQSWDAVGNRKSLSQGQSGSPPLRGAAPFSLDYAYSSPGLLQSIKDSSGRIYSYQYSLAGLLEARINPWRTASVSLFDASGRPLFTSVSMGRNLGTTGDNLPVLVEQLNYRPDGKLRRYATAAVLDTVTLNSIAQTYNYTYTDRGFLQEESVYNGFINPNTPVSGTPIVRRSLAYDAAKLGVRTRSTTTGFGARDWQVPSEASDLAEGNLLKKESWSNHRMSADGFAPGATFVTATAQLGAGTPINLPVTYDPGSYDGRWSASLDQLGVGTWDLTATARLDNGSHSAASVDATRSFALQSAAGGMRTVDTSYQKSGAVSQRTFSDGGNQQKKWDSYGRLIEVVRTGSPGDNSTWRAVYDAFGRRIQTTFQRAESIRPNVTVINSWYDPSHEFLEIAVEIYEDSPGLDATGSVIRERTRVATRVTRLWKIYGPDRNGTLGGLNGIGGLEAIMDEQTGETVGIINDFFGNVVASIRQGTLQWSKTSVLANGPIRGTPVFDFGSRFSLVEATVWLGKRMDLTGLYYLGARYYEPESGRFLSADPAGHEESFDLYSYANNDPVNYVDADGRTWSSPDLEVQPQNSAVRDSNLQYPGDGTGPITNRVYTADIKAKMSAAKIVDAMKANINTFSNTSKNPWFNSPFSAEDGGTPVVKVGAVWNIDGPLFYNPSVKVTSVTDAAITLSSMKGHPEAGFITFSATQVQTGRVIFTIDSTFQPATRIDRGMYVFPGSQIQTQIWMNFLDAVIDYSKGTGTTSNSKKDVTRKYKGE